MNADVEWAKTMADADLTLFEVALFVCDLDKQDDMPRNQRRINKATLRHKRADIKRRLVKSYLAEVRK